MGVTRREFLKLLLAGGAAASLDVTLAQDEAEKKPTRWRRVAERAAKSFPHLPLCNLCGLHCLARVTRDEHDNVYLAGSCPQHPYCGYRKVGPPDVEAFYLSLCHRPLSAIDAELSGLLPTTPKKFENGTEQDVTLDAAVAQAAALIGSSSKVAAIGGSGLSNEGCYLARRLLFGLNVSLVDTVSRRIMGPTTAAFLATLGRPGATNPPTDIINTSAILVIGADPATEMPVLSRWLFEAQCSNEAKLVVVDSRQSGFAARAEAFIHIRPGTEAAFILGLIAEALRRKMFVSSYLNKNTDISFLINDAFRTVTDANGLFSGLKDGRYDKSSWRYIHDFLGKVVQDKKLHHPRVLLSVLQKHFSAYGWSGVCSTCGISRAQFYTAFRPFVGRTSSSSQSGVAVFGAGLTARSNGTQGVRALTILQLLLGNIGVPGGGLIPVCPNGNAQGACDLGFLAGYLPGYLPSPLPGEGMDEYIERCGALSRYTKEQVETLLCAFLNDLYGDASEETFALIPRAKPDEATVYAIVEAAVAGELDGVIILGEDPAEAVGGLWLEALQHLKWVVVYDWRRPWWAKDSKASVLYIPARPFWEAEGTYTNVFRTVQWTSPPEGWATERPTDVKFLGALAAALADKANLSRVRWEQLQRTGDVLHALSGLKGKTPLPHTQALTKESAAFCWLYAGCAAGVTSPDYRDTSGIGLYPQLGWSCPDNVRVAFNRAGTDERGKPYVVVTGKGGSGVVLAAEGGKWTGQDVVDGPYPAERGGFATADGKARIFSNEIESGPLPVYYEEPLLPFENALTPAVRTVPVMVRRFEAEGASKSGVIATLFMPLGRLPFLGLEAEISKRVSGGAFVEIDEETAQEFGIKDGQKVLLKGPAGEVEASAVVTKRLKRWMGGGIVAGSAALPIDLAAKLWHLPQETDGLAAAEVGFVTLERR